MQFSKIKILFPDLIIDQEKKDVFIALLKKNNILYTLRTVPNVVGYDVIWDHKDNEIIEEIKFEFFRQIAKNN